MVHELVGRPMEILLVEDGLVDARATMASLKGSGVKHRLTLVRDGIEAMQFLRQEGIFSRAPRPDVILLDLELPRKDGREVLAEVRADYDLQRIPIVILTASAAPDDRSRGEILQVDAYLVKPFDEAEFLEVVKQLRRCWHADVILPRLE